MSSAAPAISLDDPRSLDRRVVSPWLVGIVVVIPTFMVALDQTITNVALAYIAGGLSSPPVDGAWVVTSYLVATAIVMPLTGWLSSLLGRRNYLLGSVAIFTLASAMCGLADSLAQLIVFRIVQGLAGAALLPLAQGVLLDAFPRGRSGQAMALYSFAVILAPIVGPTLGGWITVNYSWRWIFFINVPAGLISLPLCHRLISDPPYIREQVRSLWSRPIRVDGVGLGFVVLGLSSLEILNSKGQEWDWLGDPFGRVQLLMIGAAAGIGGLIAWSLKRPDAIVDVRVYRERNFWVCNVIGFGLMIGFFGGMVTFPSMLQTLYGYDALDAGLVMSPGGMLAMVGLLIATWVQSRGVDLRWIIAAGLAVIALGYWSLSRLDLSAGPIQVLLPYALVIAGVLTAFGPLCAAAFLYLPQQDRPKGTGMFALVRMQAGSIGSALLVATLVQRRMQFHSARLTDHLTPLDQNLTFALGRLNDYFQRFGANPVQSQLLAWQSIADLRLRQATFMAYLDSYLVCCLFMLAMVPLVLMMKPSATGSSASQGIDAAV